MAGPVASLLLQEPLSEAQFTELDCWLRGLSELPLIQEVDSGEKYILEFCVDKLPPFTRSHEEPSPLFTLTIRTPEVGREFHCECRDEISLLETFKYKPKEHVDISAGSNALKEHKILAQLLIELATKFKAGIINLGGEINDLTDLPGKVVEIPFSIEDENSYSIQIVDVEFLKNWLKHPNFRMVK
jgi:hypothetical protein